MNSLLLWIGGLLVAVLSLMFAAPYVIDWNAYRGVFEEEASRILGRDVRVGGSVNLRLLPAPYVRFERVRISDAGSALGEPFFRADAFTLWLSPAPLLKGAIEASEVELDRPVLRLAVDAEGRGNWQALKFTPGSLPFVPSDVVLQQVRIREGIASLKMPGTPEPLTLSGIDGEISAASFDGPYRFRGMVDWQGSRRELRVGTSQREADGRLRYKASVRVPDSGNTYAMDGLLSELTAKARHTGTLTARLPLSSFFGGLMAGDARPRTARSTDHIDFKASIDGDLDGAKLTDLAFAFEHDGKPQLMNGELTANWRSGLRMETRLASRWLDLDQIVGTAAGRSGAPADTVRRLLGQVSGMLPVDGTSLITIDVDQVNLGGEALSGVRLAMARAGGLTSIGELRAAMPGNARGELRGTLGSIPGTPAPQGTASPPTSGQSAFDGQIVLRGPSWHRFASWAGAAALLPTGSKEAAAALDAPFSVDARLRLLPDSVAFTGANVELGNRQTNGSIEWSWGAQPHLDVTAEGRSIDIASFAPGVLDFVTPITAGAGTPASLSGSGSAPLARAAERVATIERGVGAMRLRLKAGELTDGTMTVRDVEADLSVSKGSLSLGGLRFVAASGARFDLQGEIAGLTTKPAGTLRGWIAASGRDAMSSLLEMAPAGARGIAGTWLSRSNRADLGFALTLGSAEGEQIVLKSDGVIDGSRTAIDLRLDGGLAGWRDAPVSIALDIEGPATGQLLRRAGAVHGTPVSQLPPTETAPLALHLRSAGATPAQMTTLARIEGQAGTLIYAGKSAVRGDGGIDTTGELRVSSPSAADLLALAGAGARPGVAAARVEGTLGIDRKAGATTVSANALEVGTARLTGQLAITARAERTRLDGRIASDKLAIGDALGLVLASRAIAARAEPQDAPGPASPWSDEAFAFGLLDGIEGLITITAPVASLGPDLEIINAEARLALTPGKVEIQSLGGTALGGRFTARGLLEAGSGGTGVSLEVRMTGAQLGALVGGANPAQSSASGEANLVATLTSRGTSPRAVMSAAVGKGEIEIRNGRVRGIAPALIEKAALAALELPDAPNRAALERIVATERSRSETLLGNRKLAIDIVDGAARIVPIEIASPEAGLRNVTTIDLGLLKADSEWQISPRRPLAGSDRPGTRREPLPALTFVWTGPLGAIGKAEPKLSLDTLEREVSIRRMERDAEKLEDLRRQDEERARKEAERLRQLEAQPPPPGTATTATPSTAPSSGPGSAPVIQAPFPVGPAAAKPMGEPAAAPSAAKAPEPPRVTRPPPRPRNDARTLQEMFSGQQ